MYQPVLYRQTDPRWANIGYSAKGESTTIGKSGCGPTSMAMVLATWADKSVTPVSECAWALRNGFKAKGQGTYYGYFKPAAARYGLTAYMLNGSNIYGNASSQYHAKAKAAIDAGHLVIACMGKGLWTRSGHFVVVYKIDGNTIYINDPASSKPERNRGDYSLFKQQVKYYFVIEHPKNTAAPTPTPKPEPKKIEEDEDMTIEKFAELMGQYRATLQDNDAGTWSQEARDWSVKSGLVQGGDKLPDGTPNYMWADQMTREQLVTVMYRFAKMIGKA